MAAASYGMAGILLTAQALSGRVPRWEPMWFLIAAVAVNVGFYGLIRSGRNRRYHDPSLTLPQIAVANVFQSVFFYLSPGAGDVIYLVNLVTFLFGVFQLNGWQFLRLAGQSALGYAVALILLQAGDAPVGGHAWLVWATYCGVLGWFVLIAGYIGRMREQLRSRNEALKHALNTIQALAVRDELTALYNRRYLMERLSQEIARLGRGGEPFCVALLDLDHFKAINDRFGHLVGDAVLRHTACRLREAVRDVDAAGRYGGEEFLIVLAQTDLPSAVLVAERLRTAIAHADWQPIAPDLAPTVSIGVAQAHVGEDIPRLLQRADEALYAAKHGGRNQVWTAGASEGSPCANVVGESTVS